MNMQGNGLSSKLDHCRAPKKANTNIRVVEGGELCDSHEDDHKHDGDDEYYDKNTKINTNERGEDTTKEKEKKDKDKDKKEGCSRTSNVQQQYEEGREGSQDQSQRHGPTKKYWSENEDASLTDLVMCNGAKNWPTLSWLMRVQGYERSASQCRDRWLYHLDPEICHDPITEKEIARIFTLQSNPEYCNHWTRIARALPKKRTGLQVKNAVHLCERRQQQQHQQQRQDPEFHSMIVDDGDDDASSTAEDKRPPKKRRHPRISTIVPQDEKRGRTMTRTTSPRNATAQSPLGSRYASPIRIRLKSPRTTFSIRLRSHGPSSSNLESYRRSQHQPHELFPSYEKTQEEQDTSSHSQTDFMVFESPPRQMDSSKTFDDLRLIHLLSQHQQRQYSSSPHPHPHSHPPPPPPPLLMGSNQLNTFT